MANVIFSEAYDVLPALLLEARLGAGVTQRDLARRMGRSASHIHKFETRQRRVELIEFCRYIESLGADPEDVFVRLYRRLKSVRGPGQSA